MGKNIRPPFRTPKRNQLHRLPDRASYDAEAIHQILDAGFLAHVGFCIDGQPFVIPTLYGRAADTLYLHGSAASRMLREIGTGAPACVTVTLVDGLVLARSAFHHSVNYRSVVAFGTARWIHDVDLKVNALRVISEHLIAGRWSDVRLPSKRELKATAVLEFHIEDASAKARTGPPKDEAEDERLPVWAGVIPLRLLPGTPISETADTIATPDYVARFGRHDAEV